MDQNALGELAPHRGPSFDNAVVGRVFDTSEYDLYGIISVKLLDGSEPAKVWVIGSVDREPVTGDFVLISYIEGNANTPYLAGFLEDSYMRNFVQMKKDLIRLQLPIFDIGVQAEDGGEAMLDVQEHLLKDEKHRINRAIIEATPSQLFLQFPTVKGGKNQAFIKVTKDFMRLQFPTGDEDKNDGTPCYIQLSRSGNVTVQSRGGYTDLDPES